MCILGIKEQVDVNIDAECISVEKGSAPTLKIETYAISRFLSFAEVYLYLQNRSF